MTSLRSEGGDRKRGGEEERRRGGGKKRTGAIYVCPLCAALTNNTQVPITLTHTLLTFLHLDARYAPFASAEGGEGASRDSRVSISWR